MVNIVDVKHKAFHGYVCPWFERFTKNDDLSDIFDMLNDTVCMI